MRFTLLLRYDTLFCTLQLLFLEIFVWLIALQCKNQIMTIYLVRCLFVSFRECSPKRNRSNVISWDKIKFYYEMIEREKKNGRKKRKRMKTRHAFKWKGVLAHSLFSRIVIVFACVFHPHSRSIEREKKYDEVFHCDWFIARSTHHHRQQQENSHCVFAILTVPRIHSSVNWRAHIAVVLLDYIHT